VNETNSSPASEERLQNDKMEFVIEKNAKE
jgi:hypothetical protein